MTSLSVQSGDIAAAKADAIIVNLFEGVTAPGGATGAVDQALGGQVSRVIAAGGLKGKAGETLVLFPDGGVTAPRVVVVGLGKREAFGAEAARRASAAAVKAARKAGARRIVTIAHGAGIGGMAKDEAAQATVEGLLLGLYAFETYKSKAGEAAAKAAGAEEADDGALAAGSAEVELSLIDHGTDLSALEEGASRGEAIAAGVNLARDLSNHPANVATPAYLADEAGKIARRHGMTVEVWDRARITSEGMGALASVGVGSAQEPRFIAITHKPGGTDGQAPLVIAGKAVTFDTGGISLKPGLGMGKMKMDMAGGAAVLGAMEAIGQMGLKRHVVGLVGATENMPSHNATRPGDIVTALNGTTIEVLNTDAEGRMVLADVLSYAQRLKPQAVVDLATLTGAIVIALGPGAAGLFSNDDALSQDLTAAGERSGERLWRLPIWDEPYGEMIVSEVADLRNVADTSPSPAGSIYGAKFLERFVDYPWAHLDIAAMAWGGEKRPYNAKGATGYGVRLLVEWLRRAG